MQGGRLPGGLQQALLERARARAFVGGLARPAAHEAERVHTHAGAHAHADAVSSGEAGIVQLAQDGERRDFHHLGRHGARWLFPRALAFSESRLLSLLSSDLSLVEPALQRPERLKAVLRVDEDTWLLVQMHGGKVSMQPTAWRRDNRLELQLPVGAIWDAPAWDRLWARCIRS